MGHLGISLYPEHSTPEKDLAYMQKAAAYGFDRIFTCLLSVDKSKECIMDDFSRFTKAAHQLGFSVAVDTNTEVFNKLGATPHNIEPFHKIGVDTIRLDGHFDESGDIALTRNPYGIKIQYNASQSIGLDLLIERGALPQNMCVCHNFYPEPYTGLSDERFGELTRRYKSLGLNVGAFISSHAANSFGPWNVSFGLATLESDRRRPIDLQARHLLATGLVDDIIIGNCFATDDELKALSQLDRTITCLSIALEKGVSEAETHAVFNLNHNTRNDASAYMLRDSFARLEFRDTPIPARKAANRDHFKRGDVVVVNDLMERYRGEVQVILQDMPYDDYRNLVGVIPEDELFLLDFILPEYPFGFIRK